MPSGRARCAEVDHPAGTLHSASVPDRDMSDGDAFMLSFVNSSFFFSCPQKILVWTSVPPVWKPVVILSWKVKWKKKRQSNVRILNASQIPNTSSLPSLLVADSVESVALKENPTLADSQFFFKLRNFLLNFSNIFRNNTVRSYLAFRNRSHSRKGFGKIFILYHEKK